MEILDSSFGSLKLTRWPQRKNDVLRAWDAADEYLLAHLTEQNLPEQGGRVLLVNDAFGALSSALSDAQRTNWSDSMISHQSAAENIAMNPPNEDGVKGNIDYLKSTEAPQQQYDLVLIKIPKTMALLEDQLIKLKPQLATNAKVIAGGMVKHLPKSAFQLFEKHIGPLTTSLAKKKARLLFVDPDQSLITAESPYPTIYDDEAIGLPLSNHANLFSRDHLDLGARFFLEQLAEVPAAEKVMDLACGNGVLGIKYQQLHPAATIQFLDESYMAIASSQENYANAFTGKSSQAVFRSEDGLKQTADDSVELILCNPPFHQQHVIGEQIAMDLFHDSKRCLEVGGELWVVANRHLAYQEKLQRLFGNCRVVATNKKFVVLRVVKR